MTASLALPPPDVSRQAPAHRLDVSTCVHPADWARLPETLRRRFAPDHGPARYVASMRFERSAIGAVFARFAQPFRSPLPRHHRVSLPVVVDVRDDGDGVAWVRRIGAAGVVRSVKTAGPGGTVLERTDGGLGMVLDVTAEARALVFTSRSFFLAIGRWRMPIPALLTPGRCRVEHRAVDADHFRFTLTMKHPLWGTTFRQTGLFTTLEDAP